MQKLRGLYLLDRAALPMIYGPAEQRDIAEHVQFVAAPHTAQSIVQHRDVLESVDVLFSGWGSARVDEAFLDAAPNLKVIFYGAGAIGAWVTPAVWDRGVLVTSAYAANAIPVAEYTVATIVMGLKHAWSLSRQTVQQRAFVPRDGAPGCYGSTVGIVSLGMIGRTLLPLLKPFDLQVMAYDPFVSEAEMTRLGVQKASLEQVFSESNVVTVHTPDLKETEGLITGELIASMRPGATFINTARGQVVREPEMLRVLQQRPDLQAVLDVTWPEPPEPGSPLYSLPNVFLTPHIAGSVGRECHRMGRYMVEELHRYRAGEPLKWQIRPELARHSSHRPVSHAKSKGVPAVA